MMDSSIWPGSLLSERTINCEARESARRQRLFNRPMRLGQTSCGQHSTQAATASSNRSTQQGQLVRRIAILATAAPNREIPHGSPEKSNKQKEKMRKKKKKKKRKALPESRRAEQLRVSSWSSLVRPIICLVILPLLSMDLLAGGGGGGHNSPNGQETSLLKLVAAVQPQQQQQLQLQLQAPQPQPQLSQPTNNLKAAGPLLLIGQKQQQQQPGEMQLQQQQQQQLLQQQVQASSREIEKQIVDKILGEGYDKRIRPAGSGPYNASRPGSDGPTIVKVNTLVRSISKIDDVTMEYSVQLSLRQEWTDDRLAFGKMAQYKSYGLNSITLTEQERLWKPDLFFRNEKEGHFHKIIMPNVLLRIKGEGQVLYSIRISLVLACPMDLKYYPLDKQNCTIEMASYGYLDEDLKFIWKEDNPVQIAKPLNLPRFTLETHDTAYCTSRTTTGAYSCLRINLIFKREFSYYLIQIYIPCCMLVIVSWVSFWLDPNAIPARVSLGVTTLLTMATQISGINASLPPVSYTKAIDVWTGVCLTFVFGALLEFALVNYASRSDQHKREMLASALTHTQQMRWREATAAAASAGVAPPTSPPPDENSPSMVFGAGKQQAAFFGPFASLAAPAPCAAAAAHHHGFGPGQPGHLHHHHHQLGHHQPAPLLRAGVIPAAAAAAAAANLNEDHFAKAGAVGIAGATSGGAGQRTAAGSSQLAGGNHHRTISTVDGAYAATNSIAGRTASHSLSAANGPTGSTKHLAPAGTGQQLTNRAATIQQQQQQMENGLAQATTTVGDPAAAAAAATKFGSQVNCALQCMKTPRDFHLMGQQQHKAEKRKNWCKMWLAKFPTRSKRIDVISRIFFPLKFALFNLVYWTTYLFREEDIVA